MSECNHTGTVKIEGVVWTGKCDLCGADVKLDCTHEDCGGCESMILNKKPAKAAKLSKKNIK